MRKAWNPTRRNRNIGTSKAGHGSNKIEFWIMISGCSGRGLIIMKLKLEK
jgi:hypothetical protein